MENRLASRRSRLVGRSNRLAGKRSRLAEQEAKEVLTIRIMSTDHVGCSRVHLG